MAAPALIVMTAQTDRWTRLPARARLTLSILAIGLAVAGTACAPPDGPAGAITGDVAAAVNQDRAAGGLAPLAWNGQLAANAQNWADHLAATGALAHTDLGALARLPSMAGWWSLGENLLLEPGSPTGAGAEATWMASGEHRANVLNPTWNSIGVGATRDSSGRVWLVAEFGAR
jgi:uncharacterized protein YkwD